MSRLNNDNYVADLNSDKGDTAISKKWGYHRAAVQRDRKKLKRGEHATVEETIKGESETHGADGSNYVRFSQEPWGYDDFREFIRSTGQDPDKVTFTWGWTSHPLGGFWNKLIRVRPIDAAPELDLQELTQSIREWEPRPHTAQGTREAALVVGLADWQLGKGEADGTPGTIKRIKASLEATLGYVELLAAQGELPRTLVLANMGDHTEGVSGSYASQTHTTDLNVRDQISLALELNLEWLKALAPKFERVEYTATMCNHGQLSRNGGKDNITDDADNATGLIGDTLAQIAALHPSLAHVNFTIPRDEMVTLLTVEGVNLAMAHGHKISGKEDQWLAAQSQMLTHTKRFIPELWFTAHKHHAALTDYGPYTRIQATTVDPGSKWWTDATGMYSRQGTTVFTLDKNVTGHWRDYRIL